MYENIVVKRYIAVKENCVIKKYVTVFIKHVRLRLDSMYCKRATNWIYWSTLYLALFESFKLVARHSLSVCTRVGGIKRRRWGVFFRTRADSRRDRPANTPGIEGARLGLSRPEGWEGNAQFTFSFAFRTLSILCHIYTINIFTYFSIIKIFAYFT